jgi:hypothetical protein
MNGLTGGMIDRGGLISQMTFRTVFFGFAEVAVCPIHILKFCGEAPPVGKSGGIGACCTLIGTLSLAKS